MLTIFRSPVTLTLRLLSLLLILPFSLALAQTAVPVVMYGFNETSGTTTADVSGNGITGIVQGAAWAGQALSFNGKNGFVDLGNPESLQLTGSMTLSAWVAPAGNIGGSIVSKFDGTGWQLKTSADTGVPTFVVAISDGNTIIQRHSNTAVTLNTRYYVAGVYDAAAGTLDIYVNGVLDNGELTGTVPPMQTNANVSVTIGKNSAGDPYRGTIDELRVYNTALTADQIQGDMSAQIGATNFEIAALNDCDLNNDQTVNTADVTRAVDMTLGRVTPCNANIMGAGVCNVVVVQRVINATSTGQCVVGINPTRTVSLTWVASTSSNVVGYNVHRGTTSGGPYTLITTTARVVGTSYDDTVEGGQTYYYVVTAVDSNNTSSVYSNQAVASVPTT